MNQVLANHWRSTVLVVVAAVIVAATFFAGLRLGMTTHVANRHLFYSIPSAISRLYFDTKGYVILGDVAEFFMAARFTVTNETLSQARWLEPRRDHLMLFPADDKGDADFATWAFRVFGLRIESLYYFWFVLYAIPIAVFAATFWRAPARLAALCVLLLGIYAGLFALPLTTELFSVDNPRAFGIVSLVPLLHLGLALIDRQGASVLRVGAAAAQAAMIALAIHVRTTEFWQVVAVVGVAAAVLVRDRARFGVRVLWPAAVMIVATAGLEVYQRVAFERVYATTHIQHRIFWHNVGIGFALNPELAQKYSLAVDDLPMMNLVRERLKWTGRGAEVEQVFTPAGQELFHGIARDFVRYEQIAREVVLAILWTDTGEALRTFLVDKPRVLLRQLAWAAGYGGYSIEDLYLTGQRQLVATEAQRRERGIYLGLFNPWIWAGLIALVPLGAARGREFIGLALLAAWICAVSLLPAFVAYPIISVLGVALATVPFFILACGALAIQLVFQRATERRPIGEREPTSVTVRAPEVVVAPARAAGARWVFPIALLAVAGTGAVLVRNAATAPKPTSRADAGWRIVPLAQRNAQRSDRIRAGDFDGDAATDITVLRPSTGDWWTMKSSTAFDPTATPVSAGTGIAAPGDYDGDGKADIAVFQPAEGAWRVRHTSDAYQSVRTIAGGQDGDVPVPGDYDGDGKTDLAWFRPADGTWHIARSSAANSLWSVVTFGLRSDTPVPDDYDGDRKTDVAVFRAGKWLILASSSHAQQPVTHSLGTGFDVPVPGDYDGDGKADPAVYTATSGDWEILQSATNHRARKTINSRPISIPAPGDYDGDGLMDVGLFFAPGNSWFILKSSTGDSDIVKRSWGISTDVPVFKRP